MSQPAHQQEAGFVMRKSASNCSQRPEENTVGDTVSCVTSYVKFNSETACKKKHKGYRKGNNRLEADAHRQGKIM